MAYHQALRLALHCVISLTLSSSFGVRMVEAIDLSGDWEVTFSISGVPSGTTYFKFSQNGSRLDLMRSEPPMSSSGAIDPQTGEFSFDFGPFTDPFGPPGPNHSLNGAAASDGLSFEAVENSCIFEPGLGWGCLEVSHTGVRGAPPPAVCGNGTVESGESCDHGSDNGSNGCCTANCTLVDQDSDGLCDLLDNCPRDANSNQLDQDTDFIGDVCDTSTIGKSSGLLPFGRTRIRINATSEPNGITRRLFIGGEYTGDLALPDTIQLRDIDRLQLDLALLAAWTDKQCQQNPDRITCTSPDGSLEFKIHRRVNNPTVMRFRLILARPPFQPSVLPPLFVSVHDSEGQRAILFNCRPRGNGGLSCRD
jgi:hypothetical protein